MTVEEKLSHAGHFFNGASSITLALAITQPATTYKTFSQAGESLFKTLFSIRNNWSMLTVTKQLWAGFIPNAISGAGAESVAFLVYGIGKKHLQDQNGELSSGRDLLLSSMSGVLGSPANSILEQLMIRQQLYRGTLLSHWKTIYNANGLFRGIFKGSCVTAGRDMGFNIGVFALNNKTKQTLRPYIKNDLTWEFCSGLSAGAIAGFLTNPLDRAKTIMHGDCDGKYKNFRSTIQILVKKEGIVSGLFKGAGARTISIGSLICITSMLKERLPRFFPNSLKIEQS